MQFNVGDVVIVVDDLASIDSGWVGYNRSMCRYQGKKVTISSIDYENNTYHIQEDKGEWTWIGNMFKEEKTVSQEVKSVNEERRNEIKAALNLDEMMKNGYDILNECEIYNPQPEGMDKIERVWLDSKLNTSTWGDMSLFEILSKHPNYVPEKGYIAFSNEWNRLVDVNTIREVLSDIYIKSEYILEPVKIGIYDYSEVSNMISVIDRKIDLVKDIEYYDINLINSTSYKLLCEEKNRMVNKYKEFKGVFIGDNCYTEESYNNMKSVGDIIRTIEAFINKNKENFENEILIDDNIYKEISKHDKIKGVRVGQKLNKVIGKILKIYGLDKNEKYNSWAARLGDACSPIRFTRHTIISLNRNDYWTMSYGDNWCSCANIDKNHNRHSSKVGMYGDGCCSSGTESYMLDPSTVVMYTVDASYNGKDFELQDKINRCLFHVGDKKFVMGRIYPQGTDGEDAVYKQWREIFQKVIADCFGVTNFWKTLSEDKSLQYYSRGTHYADYEMSYCHVAKWSYLKETQDALPSDRHMIIGHNPICPCCGEEHDNAENIQCCDFGHICEDCGEWHEEDEMYCIDGYWYCSSCVSYCDYHQEYEHEELTYVDGCGYVCDDAISYSGDFYTCDYCGEVFYNSRDMIEIDGNIYCCDSCAEEEGYHYCYECDEWVSSDEWDEDNDMCNACAEERGDEE